MPFNNKKSVAMTKVWHKRKLKAKSENGNIEQRAEHSIPKSSVSKKRKLVSSEYCETGCEYGETSDHASGADLGDTAMLNHSDPTVFDNDDDASANIEEPFFDNDELSVHYGEVEDYNGENSMTAFDYDDDASVYSEEPFFEHGEEAVGYDEMEIDNGENSTTVFDYDDGASLCSEEMFFDDDEVSVLYGEMEINDGNSSLEEDTVYESENNPVAFGSHHRLEAGPKGDKIYAENVDHVTQKVDPNWNSIKGNRMVDLDYLLRWALTFGSVHSATCCNPKFVLEREYNSSMVSTIIFKCSTCNRTFSGKTEDPRQENQIRKSLVVGTLISGGTHANTGELLAAADVPWITFKTFIKDEEELDTILKRQVENSMRSAVEKEKAAVPSVEGKMAETTVFVDGCYGTRSYNNKYRSTSGGALIIGLETGLILGGGTLSSYCLRCLINLRKKVTKDHLCYKNFVGPAGRMEPAIIVAGLNKIYEQGLKAKIIVGDGDCTSYDAAKDGVPYGNEIEKQNCRHHAARNVRRHMLQIVGTTTSDDAKNLLRDRISIICLSLQSAIKHCKAGGGLDVEGLRQDIRNIIRHVFGDHQRCRNYFCKHVGETEGSDLSILQANEAVYKSVTRLMDTVAADADRLRLGLETNIVEKCFGSDAKFIGGKRQNLSNLGSYHRRFDMMVLLTNHGYGWSKPVLAEFTRRDPGSVYDQYVKQRENQKVWTRKSKARPNYVRCSKSSKRKEDSYGEVAVLARREISDDEIAEKMPEYRISSELVSFAVHSISDCETFVKGRIMAEHVSSIITTRKEACFVTRADEYSRISATARLLRANAAVRQCGLKVFQEKHFEQVGEKRVFFNSACIFLCAIVDGYNEDNNSILLIKSRTLHNYKTNYTDLSDAAGRAKGLGLKVDNGNVILDRALNTEVQTTLFLTGADTCHVVFVNASNPEEDVLVVTVDKTTDFFTQKCHQLINDFFYKFYVQTIIRKELIPYNLEQQ